MATFERDKPISTHEPTITVDGELKPGRHRFQLRVLRDDKRESLPDAVVVEIIDPEAVLKPFAGPSVGGLT